MDEGKKITELEETAVLRDGSYFPTARTGITNKVSFPNLVKNIKEKGNLVEQKEVSDIEERLEKVETKVTNFEEITPADASKDNQLVTEDDILEASQGSVVLPTKMRKLGDFGYEAWFSVISQRLALEKLHEFSIGGCSSFYKLGFVGRNYDWLYSNACSFLVHLSNCGGRYESISVCGGISKLTEQELEEDPNTDLFSLLPFVALDGINEWGLSCAVSVVPKTKGDNSIVQCSKKEDYKIPFEFVCRHILDSYKTVEEACNDMQRHITLYASRELDYDVHFHLFDKETTALIEFIDGEYNIKYSVPVVTNFHQHNVIFNENKTVFTPLSTGGNPVDNNKIEEVGQGLERFNLIVTELTTRAFSGVETMLDIAKKAYFTGAYKGLGENAWLSEFVGNGLTLKSDVEDLKEALGEARSAYNRRTREQGDEGEGTFQTVHSVCYDLERLSVYIIFQETSDIFESFIDKSNEGAGDNKVDKTTRPDMIYGTNAAGNQTTYKLKEVGGVGDVKVDGVSVLDEEERVANIDLKTPLNKEFILEIKKETQGDTITVTTTKKNIYTDEEQKVANIEPLATEENAGFMSKGDKEELRKLREDISFLQGKSIRLLYTEKATPQAAEIANFVTGKGYKEEDFVNIGVLVYATNHLWRFFEEEGWIDIGVDTVNLISETMAGIVAPSKDDGKIVGNTAGEGVVSGWNKVKEDIQQNANDIDALETRVEKVEEMEETLTDLTERVEDIETELEDYEQVKKDVETNKKDIAKINETISDYEVMQTTVSQHTTQIEAINEEMLALEDVKEVVVQHTADIKEIKETELPKKLDITTEKNKVYATDERGNQTTIDATTIGKVDDVKVDGVSIVSNKVANIDLKGKLDKQFIYDIVEQTTGDLIERTVKSENIHSGVKSEYVVAGNLADEEKAGYMSKGDKQELRKLREDVDKLKGHTIRIIYENKPNPSANEIYAFVQAKGYKREEFPYVAVVVKDTGHVWKYFEGQGFVDVGVDTVNQFTNSVAGIIKGSTEKGKVFAEANGTGSVVGFDALSAAQQTDEENIQTILEALTDSIIPTVNNHSTHIVAAEKDIADLKTEVAKKQDKLPDIAGNAKKVLAVSEDEKSLVWVEGGGGGGGSTSLKEWDSTVSYKLNDIVWKKSSTGQYLIYFSQKEPNLNCNPETDKVSWKGLSPGVYNYGLVGELKWFCGNAVPPDFLLCDGSQLLTTSYRDLFEVIGYTFGGTGSYFYVPNLIDRFIEGGTLSQIGKTFGAGLPNIKGSIGRKTTAAANALIQVAQDELEQSGSLFTSQRLNQSWFQATGKNNMAVGINFDASYSNSIYGNSNTVQPPALKLIPCIRAKKTQLLSI